VRAALERASSHEAPKIDDALAELGWLDMLRSEPRDAVEVVFTALGATNATATVLDDVITSALGFDAGVDLAVLLPRFAAWAPPARIEGGVVHAQGLATARVTTAKALVVVSDASGALSTVTVPIEAISIVAVRGIDPDAGFHVVRVEQSASLAALTEATAWTEAVAAGRRAVAHQVAGACRTMVDLARSHALEREQFGRPIAQFQAVRHRLSDALIAVETLEAALAAAWDEPNALTAALAKAIAGRTARSVATHCQQVLAGVGFTTDHAFHRFLKRTMALDGIFGTADDIVTTIGRELLVSRSVPTLIEL